MALQLSACIWQVTRQDNTPLEALHVVPPENAHFDSINLGDYFSSSSDGEVVKQPFNFKQSLDYYIGVMIYSMIATEPLVETIRSNKNVCSVALPPLAEDEVKPGVPNGARELVNAIVTGPAEDRGESLREPKETLSHGIAHRREL